MLKIRSNHQHGNFINYKNPECKSPGFFSFLQITFYFKIEVALAKSIHVS